MIIKLKSIVLALALATLSGCGQGASSAPEATEIAVTQSPLGSSEVGCGTGAAAATISGSGSVRSGTSYNPSTCFRAYLADVNNYNPGDLGTIVAYGSAPPTTAEECTRTSLRTYVWRREVNGTATFIDNLIRRGTWVDDGFGGKRCATPNVDVTTELPAVTAGGNYRFAVRASVLPASTEAEIYKAIYIEATPRLPRLTADTFITQMTRYATALPGAGGAIDPGVSRVFGFRSYPAGLKGQMCRTWKLQVSLMRQNDLSLKRMVQTDRAAIVDQRSASAEQVRALVCDPLPAGMTTATALSNLQAAIKTHLGALGSVQQDAMRFMNVSSSEAAQLIAQSLMIDLNRTARGCGAVSSEIQAFLNAGTLPAGMPGADILTRNCTGTSALIGARNGIGADTGGNRQTKYRACVDKQAAQFTNSCTGPRVESDPTNANPSAPTGNNGCPAGKDKDLSTNSCVDPPNSSTPTTTDEQQVQTYIQAGEQYQESTRRADTYTKLSVVEGVLAGVTGVLGGLIATGGATTIVIGTAAIPAAVVTAVPAAVLTLVAAGAGAVAYFANNSAKKAHEQMCAIDKVACQDNTGNRCAEYDLAGNRAWFQTEGSPFHPDGYETNQANQIDDCICQLFDRDYGQLPSAFQFGGPSGWCPTEKERQAEECLRNPEAPAPADGAPKLRPECLALMQPKEVDRASLQNRWCKYKMPNCTGAFVQDDGTCGCPDVVPGVPGTGVGPACQNINVLDCLPDGMLDEKTCLCVPSFAGLGCPGGGRSGYLAKTPNDVLLASFPKESAAIRSKNLLMAVSGNTPVTTRKMLDPKLTALTSVKLFTRVPTPTVSSGLQGWAVQLLCTNEGANVQNRSLGTAQLQNLTPGAQTLTFSLTAADRTACFNNSRSAARFEIRTNNQVGQPRLGFEDLSVTNLIDDLPTLPDPCRTPPKPGPSPGDPLPIQPLPFDSLFLQRLWKFSDGVQVSNPVIR